MNKLKFSSCWAIMAVWIAVLTSCSSSKDIIYFQDTENVKNTLYRDYANYEVKIMPNDNLFISVSTVNPQAAEPYNLINLSRGGMSNGSFEWQGYLVNESGDINFPEIGKIHVQGLTKTEVVNFVQTKLSQYIDRPIVNVRIMNYKVSVLGEVARPGTYDIKDERISIPEALAKAGDMTIYGQRHDVLLCRVENGEKNFYHIDLTSPEIFFSEAYYLQQNDILYVQPNKARTGAANVNPMISTVLSVTGVLVSVATLIVTLTRR